MLISRDARATIAPTVRNDLELRIQKEGECLFCFHVLKSMEIKHLSFPPPFRGSISHKTANGISKKKKNQTPPPPKKKKKKKTPTGNRLAIFRI